MTGKKDAMRYASDGERFNSSMEQRMEVLERIARAAEEAKWIAVT